MDFTFQLLTWYQKYRRSLPWRGSCNAYDVWVSEIILQQTRVEQGIVYYNHFMNAFPDVHSLAVASEEKVLRVWQGLGYYSRARNMHATARRIVNKYAGRFPETSQELVSLNGIGTYTAAAIASIVFNEPVPALDGNAYRIFTRIFGSYENIDTSHGKKAIYKLAKELIPPRSPGDFNQAVMDFGSLVCKPANPLCKTCVFNDRCYAFQNNETEKLPVRNSKRPVTERFFNYFLFEYTENPDSILFFVQQRTASDIWKKLYELPLLETPRDIPEQELFNHPWWQNLFPKKGGVTVMSGVIKLRHKLTHREILARLFRVKIAPEHFERLKEIYLLTDAESFEKLPKPRLIERLMSKKTPHRLA